MDLNPLDLKAFGRRLLKPNNFYNFCIQAMDRDLVPQPHMEMCSIAECAIRDFEKYYIHGVTPGPDDKVYYLSLTPRDSFKSTVWTECMGVYLALKHKDIRILISSETSSKAESFCSSIKDHFEQNLTMRTMYGNLMPKNRNDMVWTRSEFRLTSRKRIGLREHTFMTGGIDTTKTGMHYDIIIADDLVSSRNVTSYEMTKKVVDYIVELQSLLTPGGLLFLIGTRWHFDDAYSVIIKDPDLRSLFNIHIKSAGGSTDENRPLYFPTRLTEDFLRKKLKSQKPYFYSCQYLNNPVPEGEQTFNYKRYRVVSKKEFLRDIIPAHPYYWFYLVDPAITDEKKKRGDYTAISPYVVTANGDMYLYRAKAIRVGEDKLIDTIYNHFVSVHKDLGPSYGGAAHIEAIAFQRLLLPMLRQKEKQFDLRINWKELKTENRTSKEVRIRAAVPYLEAGNLILVEDSPNPTINTLSGANEMLRDQAHRFPSTKNDDMLDNQGFIVQIKKIPKEFTKEQKRLGWDYQMGKSEPAEVMVDTSNWGTGHSEFWPCD